MQGSPFFVKILTLGNFPPPVRPAMLSFAVMPLEFSAAVALYDFLFSFAKD